MNDRKKVFVIHGLGEKDGLGRESGGDLDTVASNAFLSAWIKDEIKGAAVYGEDYEYDFVNYSEGLRHLDIHPGCDLYLPDFPLDALPPRLEMHRIRNEEEAFLRRDFYLELEKIRKLFYLNPAPFPAAWKESFNALFKNGRKVKSEREFHEIKMAREYAGLFLAVARQIKADGGPGEVTELIADYLFGTKFRDTREKLQNLFASNTKQNIIDELPQKLVRERLLVADSAGFDFACRGRLDWRDQLMGPWVEGVSVFSSTCLLIKKLDECLSPDAKKDLAAWLEGIKKSLLASASELLDLIERVDEANPNNSNVQKMLRHLNEVVSYWDSISYRSIIEFNRASSEDLAVQITESQTGRPVENLEVLFNVSEGPARLSAPDAPDNKVKNMAVPTNENGIARARLDCEQGEKFGVTVTHNDLDFITYPENLALSKKYFEEHPDPDSIEFRLVEYLSGEEQRQETGSNIDRIEAGDEVASRRALQVQCELIERDVKYLAEQDVRLVRLDDHHPYTPAILQQLEELVEKDLIEAVVTSSKPRGQEQPIELARCGADLIYDQFIKGTSADNPGLSRLREEAHYQDLHIKRVELALEISKLIGSKYDKTEITERLSEVKTEAEIENIMEAQGWDQEVREYEETLEKLLPRLEKATYRIRLVNPPQDRDYCSAAGWRRFLHPLKLIFGDKNGQFFKELYARSRNEAVTIFCALSPFCDASIGEPSINVASALNYLRRFYKMDYFFYAYGSFLLSTRRVNEEGFTIDLSNLVSQIGSPADGGHAAAATGSPNSKPAFPEERFDRVSAENFAEYIYYLTDITMQVTGLEMLQDIEELPPQNLEVGMPDVLERLDKEVYKLTLSGPRGELDICTVMGLRTGKNEVDLTMPLALVYLKQKYSMDYLFYSLSPNKLIMRNVHDDVELIDLDETARKLGTFRDGGHPRAAACQPRFNPKFDEKNFQYIIDENMEEYVHFLGSRLIEELPFEQFEVEEYKSPESDNTY